MLDIAYLANINAVPSQLSVATEGWRVLRDLTNGLLILILIWIAITIILNLEEYGGKRLLVRVIAAGLLINFSLVFVTIPFALGNELARPFVKALGVSEICETVNGKRQCTPPRQTISQVIINNSRLHQVTKVVTDKGALDRLKAELEELSKKGTTQLLGSSDSFWQHLGAPQTAKATPLGAVGAIAACGFLGIATAGWAILLCGAAASIITAVGTAAFLYYDPLGIVGGGVNLLVGSLFMFLMVLTFVTAAVIMYLRLFAMMLLGVVAPIAFIAMAVPIFGERLWNQWLDNLLRWAFVAPVFYFLLYLALYMLQLNAPQSQTITQIPFPANVPVMINLILFLVFLWAAVFFTRKMAGQFAEIALSGLRQGLGLAGGYGLGVLKRRALPYLGQKAEAVQERIGRAGAVTRGLLKTPTGVLRRVAKAGRDQIIRDSQEFGSMTSAEIQRAIGAGGMSDTRLAAAMMVLQKNKDIEPLKDSQGNAIRGYDAAAQRRGIDVIRQAGLDHISFLRANPKLARAADFNPDDILKERERIRARMEREQGLAPGSLKIDKVDQTQAAQSLAWKRVRPGDYPAMDLGTFDGDNADSMKEMYLEYSSPASLSELARLNPARREEINTYLTEHPQRKNLLSRMGNASLDYFATNAAGELGWRLPLGATAEIRPTLTASASLRHGLAGEEEEWDLEPRGGKPPYKYEYTPLPPNFEFDSVDGILKAHSPEAGTYNITVRIIDDNGRDASKAFRIVIEPR
mgnify:FL=1